MEQKKVYVIMIQLMKNYITRSENQICHVQKRFTYMTKIKILLENIRQFQNYAENLKPTLMNALLVLVLVVYV